MFPLAAVRCGIEPVWASEIEKAPISITKRHFPDMAHLGDVTKLDGRDLPPVHTMLSLGGVADKLNRDSFGIATTSFEDMKAFYADSYELILDFVDVAIGLNNIAVRGDYNLFPTDSVKGRKKKQVGTFEEYRELIKSAKLDFLMDNEPFSKAIILNRNVRNAIAHFNYDFDSDSQRIIFSDKHKGRENAVELYLIDLAILCYENISVLTYLNELLYTLRKIEYVSEGMCIHIKRS